MQQREPSAVPGTGDTPDLDAAVELAARALAKDVGSRCFETDPPLRPSAEAIVAEVRNEFRSAARTALDGAGYARLTAERDEARWQQERCHRHHEASDADRDRALERVEHLSAEQAAHEGELGDMRAQLSAAEADRDRYAELIDQTQATNDTLIQQRDEARAQIDALTDYLEAARTDLARLHEVLPPLLRERDALRQHILDIDAHATPYGDIPDEPGWVGTYLVTAGSLHRALGKIGHSAPRCEAEAALQRVRDELPALERNASDFWPLIPIVKRLEAVLGDSGTSRTPELLMRDLRAEHVGRHVTATARTDDGDEAR